MIVKGKLSLLLVVLAISMLSYFQIRSHDDQTSLVKIDGSSTVFPITEAVAEEFQAENPKVKVTVGVSGTGGGFKKFAAGEIDISNASRPIKADEIAKGKEKKVALVACMRKLIVILNIMIGRGETWDASRYPVG